MDNKEKTRKTEENIIDSPLNKKALVCPECGNKNIRTNEQDHTFTYGIKNDKIKLSARIPIRKCIECGFSFTDYIADNICHEVICHHLGVMSPAQIKALRNSYKLTQAQFSEITKLNEAILSRWERGIFIQNKAYDNYLYLLGFKENINRLSALLKKKNKIS